ncbi:hypothetical protein [Psychromonas sp. GE-S-Ul-11]|uniref:hypothetical protein n=1 Tax=Psychromonas sp. GE-S-Ul-11 TaxID=3241170 RepID=UPI00390C9F04
MKVTCPHCQEKISLKDIKSINKNSIYVEKQCPSCDGWFSLNKRLTKIKTLGMTLLLITSLLNIFGIKSEFSIVFSSIGLVGVLVALLITFIGKNEKVDKPRH